MPSLVGTSREMTGRVLRELERERLIARVGHRGLRLLRPDRLELDAQSRPRSAATDGRAIGWRPVAAASPEPGRGAPRESLTAAR